MGIFSKIMGAIFGSGAEASSEAAGRHHDCSRRTIRQCFGAPVSAGSSSSSRPPPPPAASRSTSAKVLDDAVKAKGQKLEWRTSIVDLLKALDIDSSLAARKELARELNYTGDTNNSATMNIWLHRQVIVKLEENGGKVPADLKD